MLAGAPSISLLKNSELGEEGNEKAKEYNAMPVSGEFMVTFNKNITSKHNSKLYESRGKKVKGPPMSDPHLDVREVPEDILREKLSPKKNKELDEAIKSGNIIKNPENENIKILLFGPFPSMRLSYSNAEENKKWGILKDIISQPITVTKALIASVIKNPEMVSYLAVELSKKYIHGKSGRIKTLQRFIPDANPDNWEEFEAGVRAQILKSDGEVVFGTEVVSFNESIVSLLGASPGATIGPKTGMDIANQLDLEQNIEDNQVDIPCFAEAKFLLETPQQVTENGDFIFSQKEYDTYAKIVSYKKGREVYFDNNSYIQEEV